MSAESNGHITYGTPGKLFVVTLPGTHTKEVRDQLDKDLLAMIKKINPNNELFLFFGDNNYPFIQTF